MKQLVIAGSFPISCHTFVTNEVASTIQRGHDVIVLAPSDGDAHGESHARRLGINDNNVIYSNFRKSPLLSLDPMRFSRGMPAVANRHLYGFVLGEKRKSFFCSLARDRRLRNLDLIHAHFTGWASEIALPLSRILGVPLTVHAHNIDSEEACADQRDGLIELRAQATYIAFPTHSSKSKWLAVLGAADAEKLVVVPQGVDLEEFRAMSPPLGRERVEWISVCRLAPEKRLQDSLVALKGVCDRGIQVHYTVVGGGPEANRLRSLANELGVAQHVTFAGNISREEVVMLLGRADIFVHPSEKESFGVAIVEAMASRLAVVAARSTGAAEVVSDERNGYLVDVGDTAQMIVRLVDLSTDAALRGRMGDAGYEIASDRFSWERHMADMIDLWTSACRPRGAFLRA